MPGPSSPRCGFMIVKLSITRASVASVRGACSVSWVLLESIDNRSSCSEIAVSRGSCGSSARLCSKFVLIAVIDLAESPRRGRRLAAAAGTGGVALHAREQGCSFWFSRVAVALLAEHGLAFARELTELDHGVADGHEQRQRHEAEPEQHQCRAVCAAARIFTWPGSVRSGAPLSGRKLALPRQRGRDDLLEFVVARCQPSSRESSRPGDELGGSPARRGASCLAMGWPATFSTIAMSSRTL